MNLVVGYLFLIMQVAALALREWDFLSYSFTIIIVSYDTIIKPRFFASISVRPEPERTLGPHVPRGTAMTYQPPFKLTNNILALVANIQRLVGRFEGFSTGSVRPELRRQNRMRSVQSSCAIEGNSLSLEQVSTILDGSPVVAPAKDILEVTNANNAYAAAGDFVPHSVRDFKRAHRLLMAGLIADAGKFRTGNVGIINRGKVQHVAPKAPLVPKLMADLMDYLKACRTVPRVVVACVAHYEIEFIHPFSDGNGRVGRLWQHVILVDDHPVFAMLPVESVIRASQTEYYQVLRACDRSGDSTLFVEFSLQTIEQALTDLWESFRAEPSSPGSRIAQARAQLGSRWFARKDYLKIFKSLSSATAARDLAQSVADGLLEVDGARNQTRYRFL